MIFFYKNLERIKLLYKITYIGNIIKALKVCSVVIQISVSIPNLNFGFNLTRIEFELKKFNLNIKNNCLNQIKYQIGFD